MSIKDQRVTGRTGGVAGVVVLCREQRNEEFERVVPSGGGASLLASLAEPTMKKYIVSIRVRVEEVEGAAPLFIRCCSLVAHPMVGG